MFTAIVFKRQHFVTNDISLHSLSKNNNIQILWLHKTKYFSLLLTVYEKCRVAQVFKSSNSSLYQYCTLLFLFNLRLQTFYSWTTHKDRGFFSFLKKKHLQLCHTTLDSREIWVKMGPSTPVTCR